MIGLGIHDGHNATACLIVDGQIKACIAEERLVRIKNWCGFPQQAIQACLRSCHVDPAAVNAVGVAGLMPPIYSMSEIINPKGFRDIYKHLAPVIPKTFIQSDAARRLALNILSRRRNRQAIAAKLQALGIQASPHFYDHHWLHALSAYACSPYYNSAEKVLVLSCDGSGDAACGSVNVAHNGTMERLAVINREHSIGEIYARVTQFLGMKPLSDEYKVMGLAAYANKKYAGRAYNQLKDYIVVDPHGLGFKNNSGYSKWRYLKAFDKIFQGERFDTIAYAAQKFVEKILSEWLLHLIQKTGIQTIILSGGVFMNIKANYILLSMPQTKNLWVLPSCADDSLSIGAAVQANIDHGEPQLQPLRDLYLGMAYSHHDVEQALRPYAGQLQVQQRQDIDSYLGQQLAQGHVIGRLAGKMEWGARALGNRSILADPRNTWTASRINRAIKKRDFWMPYCPSLLAERADDYFDGLKNYTSDYMIMAFPSRKKALQDIPACMHAYDQTIRPQTVRHEWNPRYHALLRSFEQETGVGGVLNTSFNLSGYPIVASPADALDVFMQSDLDALALEEFYITKNKAA